MKTIIIGLGNPGTKFKNTRHNVGFMAIDKFAEENNFPDFELEKKSNSLFSEKDDVLLAKPQTFMNESGKAVKIIVSKENTESLIIIHDDIDLPIGKIKIVKERGSAGHKGVENIIQNIGNNNLVRFRIGIASQSCGPNHRTEKAEDIVLKKFTPEEQKVMNEVIAKTSKALDFFLQNGLEKTMNEYN